MTFNSLIFIFAFFPIAILAYFLTPTQKLKNIVLLIFSLIFYAWDNPFSILILILMIFWNYASGIELKNAKKKSKKISLIVCVVVNLIILCVYKYTNFILGTNIKIGVPLGLSFFTFSSLSYIFDVAYGKCRAQYNIFDLAFYIAFFGKMSMGPIVQYNDMEVSINNHPMKFSLFKVGMMRFVKGLIKKVLLADQLSLIVTSLTGNSTVLGSWLLAIAYTLQLYFDFSGYSDMAIGIGNVFGFEWKENFNHPYTAVSVQDFWRRWHISLSTWFRDYLYIPLGGSRVGNIQYIRNIMIVWLATGFWHGANWTFIVWGLYYGLLLILEKFVLKNMLSKNKIIGHIYTMLVVIIGWVFFMSADISTAIASLGHMFGIAKGFADGQSIFVLSSNLAIFLLGIIFSTDIYATIENILFIRFKKKGVSFMMILYTLLFVLCIAFIIGSSYQTFLYSAF
ncbi:MAG: MBOAT family protein [Firmicutes bacterium]|nr:MBOAT family protein [Bacillota bacterium]